MNIAVEGNIKIDWLNRCLTTNPRWVSTWEMLCKEEVINLNPITDPFPYAGSEGATFLLVTLDEVNQYTITLVKRLREQTNLPMMLWISFYTNEDMLNLRLAGADCIAEKSSLSSVMKSSLYDFLKKPIVT